MDTPEKPTLTVRPGGRTPFDPRTQQDARELVAALSGDDHSVVLQLPDPGQFAAQDSLETISIVIGTAVSMKVLDMTVESAVHSVTGWIRKRFGRNEKASPVYVTIYGPDGKPLKNVLGRSADHIKDMTPPHRTD